LSGMALRTGFSVLFAGSTSPVVEPDEEVGTDAGRA